MGLYPCNCSICKKAFMWFSGGNPYQLCDECFKTATIVTAEQIKEGFKNFEPKVPLKFTVAALKAAREK